ncbi:substrate-binding domain-containing protein [Alkalilimnicola sp. S0819]|uniref:substrate-binding domain-containing protein n=1 Tax=Alkalilimnicola sp. S0819 TaxID=2613922 RepID=UPI00126145C6|nr:substrate-binding domain-containing protein [Alkalilimnicola sp. S0819]KAB7628293.1 ABC transporter substrate-binding protein [Alkalilimnicola sp. S0819]MPQ15190.1 ABC transporter substrate-binding protein [Alkalilimnicola sp. S0819]
MKRLLQTAAIAASVLAAGTAAAADPIKIAHVAGFTGPLEPYAKQLQTGMEMGFEYATNGTNKVLGRDIEILQYDSQLKPDRARALLEEAYGDEDVTLAVGPVASGVAIASLPIAEMYEKIIIPEGVADSITGKDWNRYVVRIGRNSSQDAISNAVAVADEGVCIATLAQDYAFGRDGVAAYKKAAEELGATIVHEEYVPTDATDFTAPGQRIIDALRNDDCEERYAFLIWAGGGNPLAKLADMNPGRYGITLTTGGNILPALAAYKVSPGMEGAGYYYYENPNNDVNDWLVKEHFKRFNSPPDFFTAQGMAQAMAIVAAIEKAGATDTESLLEAFQGLTFNSPKGELYIRPEDQQTLQPMYHFKIKVKEGVDWAVPELVREIGADEMNVPILN